MGAAQGGCADPAAPSDGGCVPDAPELTITADGAQAGTGYRSEW